MLYEIWQRNVCDAMCLMCAAICSHCAFFARWCVTLFPPRISRTLVPPSSVFNLRWWCYMSKRLTALMSACVKLILPIACQRKPLSKRFNNTLHIVQNLITTVLQLLNPTHAKTKSLGALSLPLWWLVWYILHYDCSGVSLMHADCSGVGLYNNSCAQI